MADQRRIFARYLQAVFVRFKLLFGGGSLLVLAVGVYEHYSQQTIDWSVYASIMVACLVIAVVVQGAGDFGRLLPSLRIPAGGLREQTAPDGSFRAYYFAVENTGGTTIENVSTRLVEISPEVVTLSWLPVSLHIKHDNDSPHQTQMQLNPHEKKHVDLVSKVDAHTDMGLSFAQKVDQRLPQGRYELTVEVTGKDVPRSTAQFQVWTDEMGSLHCIEGKAGPE